LIWDPVFLSLVLLAHLFFADFDFMVQSIFAFPLAKLGVWELKGGWRVRFGLAQYKLRKAKLMKRYGREGTIHEPVIC
jgi:hypothetical protein